MKSQLRCKLFPRVVGSAVPAKPNVVPPTRLHFRKTGPILDRCVKDLGLLPLPVVCSTLCFLITPSARYQLCVIDIFPKDHSSHSESIGVGVG